MAYNGIAYEIKRLAQGGLLVGKSLAIVENFMQRIRIRTEPIGMLNIAMKISKTYIMNYLTKP